MSLDQENQSSDNHIIQQTQCWLKSIIIDLNLCPFANREFIRDSIGYSLCPETDIPACLQRLAEEFHYLDSHPETETSLLIFSAGFSDFNDFLALIHYANLLLEERAYDGIYQLAHFHPEYCFEGVEQDDPSNYTNRSPWPTLHLIREDSLQKAIEKHPNPAEIPNTNIELTRQMGSAKMQALLRHCTTQPQRTDKKT